MNTHDPAASTPATRTDWTLGSQGESTEFPHLALDPDQPGIWGTIDRWAQRVASWLNPILIKEARQSLKSKQFIITFFLLLLASCLWTVLGIVTNSPDVYFVPTGERLLTGYYLILAIPLIGLVPLAAYRSLASEIDDDTFEMLVLSQLSSMRIVMGKLNSAVLQMMVYFAAIVPCLAFTYLLRGVDLPTIGMLIGTVFFTALLVTSFALTLATAAPNRTGQTLALLGILGVIVFAEFTCAAFVLGGLITSHLGSDPDTIMGFLVYVVVGATCIALFLMAAAARIAPVTENRSTGLRRCMFIQQLVWIGAMALIALWYSDANVINFGIMVIAGYWLVLGTLMLSESPELSPRVQRDLPKTFAGRALLTWFNPGPGTGYVFAIATGTVGASALGMFGTIIPMDRQAETHSILFATIMIGYLLAYLGIIRLIVMPLSRRFGRTLSLPAGVLLLTLIIGGMLPTVLTVMVSGAPPFSYTPIEAIDWAWTIVEAFDNPYSPSLALLILMTGIVITLVNLGLLVRALRYRRVPVPQRVIEDAANQISVAGSTAV